MVEVHLDWFKQLASQKPRKDDLQCRGGWWNRLRVGTVALRCLPQLPSSRVTTTITPKVEVNRPAVHQQSLRKNKSSDGLAIHVCKTTVHVVL